MSRFRSASFMSNPLSNFLDFVKAQNTTKYLGGAVATIAGICICTTLSLNTCYAVTVDDEQIGYITSPATFENAMAEAKEQTEAATGLEISDPLNVVFVEVVHTLFAPKMSSEELVTTLSTEVEWLTQGAVLNVNNGEQQFTLSSLEEGQQILDTLVNEAVADEDPATIKDTGFLETVNLEERNVRLSELTTTDEALAAIKAGKEAIKIHNVAEGESLWTIARNNDLTVDELKALNPQLTTERLQIGQELQLTQLEPLLSVVITKEVTLEESIPYGTTVTETDKLLKGEKEVTTAGIEGIKNVTYAITETNGVALEKTVLNEVVLSEPVNEVVSKGTSTLMVASRSGSGALDWPKNGKINSPYGYRSRGFHTGIDISAKTGDTISAAAGGKVTLAGWAGGYGYCILIDHNNGLKTRYAHLSKINVSVGDTVLRGQAIGKAGSTGNSTGPHLHFEVIVNGDTKNPLNYLN